MIKWSLTQKIMFRSYIFFLKLYGKNKRIHGQLTPTINISKMSKLLFIVIKIISSQFDPIVKKQMNFYLKKYNILSAVQEPLGVAVWLNFLKITENLDGDVLELGVYKGGLTCITANYLKDNKSDKKVYACDTYSGIPYDDKFSNVNDAKDRFSDTSIQHVQEKLEEFDVTKKVELIQGLFEDTLYQKLSNHKFSLILIDCDVYDATKISLEFAYQHLTKHGIIMLDDYERAYTKKPLWGATKAINEFAQKNKLIIHTFPDNYIIKE